MATRSVRRGRGRSWRRQLAVLNAANVSGRGARDHGPNIKDDEQYEALREQGMSKEKAARIANTPRKEAGRKGGEAAPYEEWTVDELQDRAAEVGIEGRSSMDKAELIEALREH